MLLIERLRDRFLDRGDSYVTASPFPHAVFDDVLPTDVFDRAVREFPPIDDLGWDAYLHVNETKFANRRRESWGPTLQAIVGAMCSDEFSSMLCDLTGFDGLISDPTMDGGGLHQTRRGGHLNVHTDFTTHHRRPNLRRRVNVLLYLNEGWFREWGGALELWDADVRRPVSTIEPTGNRMLVFTTSGSAFHGHPDPLRCPHDMARRSLALYYFTAEDQPERRATDYRARPDDGLKRIAIKADQRVLGVYDWVKVKLGVSDHTANRLLKAAHRAAGPFRRRF